MLIKKETEYAVLGLLALSSKEGFVDSAIIAEETSISGSLLRKTFQKLAKVGILKSKLGPQGGFKLALPAKQVTLKDIVSATQDSNIHQCFEGGAPYCPKRNCSFKKAVFDIESTISAKLDEITLDQLV